MLLHRSSAEDGVVNTKVSQDVLQKEWVYLLD